MQILVDLLSRSTYVTAESEDLPVETPIPNIRLSPNFNMTYKQLKRRVDLRTNPSTSELYYQDILYLASFTTEETLDSLEENSHRITRVAFESLNLENHSDSNSAEVMGASTSRALASALDDKLFLDDFFKRPVLISSFPILLDTFVDNVINPWELWSSQASVRNKLAHYAYFRGNLKLRFNLSTTKFHYGTVMASYQPLPSTNRNYLVHKSIPSDEQRRKFRQNYLSQTPDLAYINAGQDDDVQMDLPFITPNQHLRLFNPGSINILDNTIPYGDFITMGELFLTTLGKFHSQTDAVETPPYLTIYAWMEDVELSTPTNTRITVAAESEFLTNPVSSIATAVSGVAERLEDVPIISTFAKATNIAATAISQIALMFGFSKPVNVEPASFAKQVTFSNGAIIIGKDTAFKLTCDPKQELALMNNACGSGDHDALAHKYITSIPTLIDTFTLDQQLIPYTDTIFQYPVLPMLGTHMTNAISNPQFQVMQFSAMSQAALHYRYWRGTISYRFDVTAANFTRGKLLFIYEPNGTESFADRSNRDTILNQQYMATMDLEKERSITIHVGFNHHKTFAKTFSGDSFSVGGVRDYRSSFGDIEGQVISANNLGQATGVLSIRNATTITGIDVNQPLYIHTYVYSNDLELAEPQDTKHFDSMVSTVTAESSYEQGEPLNKVQMKDEHRVTVSGKELLINRTVPDNHDIYMAHFGEKIQSLRVLLKRDQMAFVLNLTGTNNILTHPIWPPYQVGTIPKSINIPSEIGFRNTFNIMRFCYLGMRGGMRYRNFGSSDGFVGPCATKLVRTTAFTAALSSDTLDTSTFLPGASGGIIQNPLHGGIEYEIPYKQNHLFDSPGLFRSNATIDREDFNTGVILKYLTSSVVGKRFVMCSIAEDFNFIRFQGAGFYTLN